MTRSSPACPHRRQLEQDILHLSLFILLTVDALLVDFSSMGIEDEYVSFLYRCTPLISQDTRLSLRSPLLRVRAPGCCHHHLHFGVFFKGDVEYVCHGRKLAEAFSLVKITLIAIYRPFMWEARTSLRGWYSDVRSYPLL